jgi:hypothetical protein
MTPRFRRRPGDDVDGGGVVCELVDALPLPVLLAEDEDAAVIAAAGEDGAVFGVRPGDAPDGAVVAVNSLVCDRFVEEAECGVPFECFC